MSLEEGFNQLDWKDNTELTLAEHHDLDHEIFLCEECGWWCEACEANENPNGGGDICNDCIHEDE